MMEDHQQTSEQDKYTPAIMEVIKLLEVMEDTSTRELGILAELVLERQRQDKKFPHQAPGSGVSRFSWPMLGSLMEELGEVAKDQVEENPEKMRRELVQLGALAIKALAIEYEREEEESTPEAIARRREADALFNVGDNA